MIESAAYDVIRQMPSRTTGDYKAILHKHAAELLGQSSGLHNDMMALASGDASRFYLASEVTEIAQVMSILARQIQRLAGSGAL